MQIFEVKSAEEARKFIQLPRFLYKADPYWICHLDQDVEAVFDPRRNKQFETGSCARWILQNEQGQIIGRIAAFVSPQLAKTYEVPTGGMGFFECINDQQAAFLLLDTACHWLKHQGMQAVEGPVNFGEKDRFWGLLVEGHQQSPLYLVNYNPPYYKDLLEAYGFKNYYEQYIYRLTIHSPIPPIVERKYQRLIGSEGYHIETLKLSELDRFAEDFREIYNQAWKDMHKHFKPISKEQAIKTFKSMKSVIDPDLVIFAYHHQRPIAVFISIPELNRLFRYVNGKLNLWGKLQFVFHRWRGACTTVYGMVFGIIPEYRNKGAESLLILGLKNKVQERHFYKDMYIVWIGDFNPKMIRIIEMLSAQKKFTLVTYRKQFDPNAPFERHPVLD